MAERETSSGIGLGGVLLVLFITLKLLGKITWSWWWVLSPLWIGFAIGGVLILVTVVLALIVSAFR